MCTFFLTKSTPVFIFFFVCRLDSTCRDNGSFTTANKHNHEFSFSFLFLFLFILSTSLLKYHHYHAQIYRHSHYMVLTGCALAASQEHPGVCSFTEGSSCKTEHFCGGSISTTNVDLVPSSMVNNLSSGLGTATIQGPKLSCQGADCATCATFLPRSRLSIW